MNNQKAQTKKGSGLFVVLVVWVLFKTLQGRKSVFFTQIPSSVLTINGGCSLYDDL